MTASAFQPGTVLLLDLLKERGATLFRVPRETVTCHRLADVAPALARLEEAQADGLHATGYLAYEAGFAFEDKLRRRFVETGEPLLWFGLYDAAERLELDAARALLAGAAGGQAATASVPGFDMDPDTYGEAFAAVRDHLEKGDAYQVNLTMRASVAHDGPPEALFLDLLRRQPVEFAAFLCLEGRSILSLSPELFLERRGTRVVTRPMKGTAPRGRTGAEDRRLARELASDPKQRSENTMIVDLMRNDLSRIAETGSVRVSALCAVERYQSLHQMTSTVEAEVPTDTGFASIIANLFPCGSITGAPKLSAMTIADDLETGPRGVYTGSIGHLVPGGNFRLNVAIRTLDLKPDGTGVAGAGSGVVHDSGAAPEYDECVLKLKFLTDTAPAFGLIETMAFHPGEGFLLEARHLARLAGSADYFGFRFEEGEIRAALLKAAAGYDARKRVRLVLQADGALELTATDFANGAEPAGGSPAGRPRFALALARETTCSSDRFLYHKTTNRAFYDDTRKRYQAETGCQEVLFMNENGFLTEGSYTTLFLRRNGRLLTPALEHGLLPGTLRAGLLERGIAVEADLTPADIETADDLLVGNSVRGLIRARVMPARAQGAVAR